MTKPDALALANSLWADWLTEPTPETLRNAAAELRGVLSVKAALAAQVAQAEPMEMALCESTSVVLREGQLYRFRRVGDCERCAEMSKASFEAYGEPPKEQA